jgi:hypothetical protein
MGEGHSHPGERPGDDLDDYEELQTEQELSGPEDLDDMWSGLEVDDDGSVVEIPGRGGKWQHEWKEKLKEK